jgi:hypothetical protein
MERREAVSTRRIAKSRVASECGVQAQGTGSAECEVRDQYEGWLARIFQMTGHDFGCGIVKDPDSSGWRTQLYAGWSSLERN